MRCKSLILVFDNFMEVGQGQTHRGKILRVLIGLDQKGRPWLLPTLHFNSQLFTLSWDSYDSHMHFYVQWGSGSGDLCSFFMLQEIISFKVKIFIKANDRNVKLYMELRRIMHNLKRKLCCINFLLWIQQWLHFGMISIHLSAHNVVQRLCTLMEYFIKITNISS